MTTDIPSNHQSDAPPSSGRRSVSTINIPLSLTVMRILMIPIIVLFFYLPFQSAHIIAAVLFIIACITDWLDGFLARSLSQATDLGAFLDPIADKLLVAVVLVVIVAQDWMPYLAIPAAIIIGREIAIAGLREWMAEMGKRTSMAVSFMAKVKTSLQMLALIMLLWYVPGSTQWVLWIGVSLLYLAALLTLWSMTIYLKLAWPDLTLVKK